MRPKLLTAAVLCLALTCTVHAQRPHDPWVERITTHDFSRQLYVALASDMWLMYSLPHGALYRAWNGGTSGGSLKKASYWHGGGAHFPHHYAISGTEYFKEEVGEYFSSWTKKADIDLWYTKSPKFPYPFRVWSVHSGAGEVPSTFRYRGYLVKIDGKDAFQLNMSLILDGGGEIRIAEQPERTAASTLTRTYSFTGIPAGHEVHCNLLTSTSGGWQVVSGAGTVTGTTLSMNADGQVAIQGNC